MTTPLRAPSDPADRLAFLAAAGTAAACARAVDWARTPLGPIGTWPESLRTVVGLVLRSRHPMLAFWGPELIQFYNDAFLPSFGVGKHPLAMGQPARECWQETWPIIAPQLEGAMIRAQSTFNEDQHVPVYRNGRLEEVYWTYGYSPVFDEMGEVGGALVVCTETTNRVVAERRLRGARSLSEQVGIRAEPAALMGVAAKCFSETSTDMPFVLIFLLEAGNLRAVASSCLTQAELAFSAPFLREQLQRTLASEERASGDTLRDAGRLPVPKLARSDLATEVYFTALRPASEGSAIGYVVFGLSAMLPFDTPYQEHLDELAQILSRACSREALRAGREKIQQELLLSDRMVSIGTLAAGAAHEINNPLAYMTANLDMALEEIRTLGGGSAPALMRELEDLIMASREGAERVHKIVLGLKTFSQTEEERRTVVEIGPVLELSLNMVFNEIRHRARLVKDFGVTPPVKADGARLAQVFVNLLVNAAQALPRSEAGTNEIHIATSTDAAGRAVIEVRDTGMGIPKASIDRIFDPFYTTKPVGIGTGLGLSICHNIVSALGGEISVKSEEGRGATFRVTLPPALQRQQELDLVTPGKESTEPHSADSLRGTDAPAPRRALVLVVDDEPAVGLMLARALREHDVTISVGAKEALELLTSGREFDVILSDLMMPRMSGMDFHAELTQRFPALVERLVFVTGGAFSAAARAFLLRIPNQRIEKPLDVTRLRTLVRNIVN